MDAVDRRIIGTLAEDARISVTDLADSIPLSLSATSERLRRLRHSGIIRRFTVELDLEAVGRTIRAVIDVRVHPDADTDVFDAALGDLAPVVGAMHLTGRFDYQLEVAARDVAELDELLAHLKNELGAQETNTRLVLKMLDGFPRSVAL